MAQRPSRKPRKPAPHPASRKAGGGRKARPEGGGAAGPRLVNALLALLATHPWQKISMADIARAAGLAPADAVRVHAGKTAVLKAFLKQIDGAVLAAPGGDGSVRDRLFDLSMGRFDALAPHKKAVTALAADPCAAACLLAHLLAAMSRTLDHAGAGGDGLEKFIRTNGLALIFANAFRVWIKDDSPDMGPTMAALDRGLRRAEALVSACPGRRRTVTA